MHSPSRRFAVLALGPLCFLFSGCGLLNLQNLTGSTSGSSSTANFTGNYMLTGAPSSSTGALPSPVTGMVGALSNTGSAFTGTFRVQSTNGCISPTQDVAFTGTSTSPSSISSGDQIVLNSTNLPGNPIAITLLADPTQSSNGIGTYTISGSGLCAQGATNFLSDQYTAVTGTYTGTFSSSGAVADVTAVLTQGAANGDGQFPETGTVTLVTSACKNTFTLTGVVTGPTLTAVFNQTAAGNLGGFTATLPDHAQTLTVTNGITVTGACNAGNYAGSLALQ